MTEADWLASDDPQAMLSWAQGEDLHGHRLYPLSDRKLRLFACACCRAHMGRRRAYWNEGWCAELAAACEIGEQAADGLVPLPPWREAISVPGESAWVPHDPDARSAVLTALSPDHPQEDASLLRCILGNPFRPAYVVQNRGGEWSFDARTTARLGKRCVSIGMLGHCILVDRACLTPSVLGIAEAIYADRRFEDLPILADALEEAGCTDDAILRHCRGPGPHMRGCHVLDLILGKE
jgi:hypothetical protein